MTRSLRTKARSVRPHQQDNYTGQRQHHKHSQPQSQVEPPRCAECLGHLSFAVPVPEDSDKPLFLQPVATGETNGEGTCQRGLKPEIGNDRQPLHRDEDVPDADFGRRLHYLRGHGDRQGSEVPLAVPGLQMCYHSHVAY